MKNAWHIAAGLALATTLWAGAGDDILARSVSRGALDGIIGRSLGAATAPKKNQRVSLPSMLDRSNLERIGRYDALIQRYSRTYELDVDLVRALIYVESGGRADAVSKQGAAGLMQLMPETGRQWGAADRFDPEENIAAGTRYLRALIDQYQSVEVALWAYNAGPGNVRRGRMPSETKRYVPRVLTVRRFFKEQRSA